MPTIERIETWHGQDVLDGAGDKAGHLEEVYYDPATHEPVLISVKHGMLGRQASLVPATEAVVSRDYIRVPYSAEQIQHSESNSATEELSSEQTAAVGALFKLTLPSTGPLYSANLIARRRTEAEKADRRANEMELEAQRQATELEEARERASAAAQTAERQRQG